jgi:hypothetical protein
MGVRKFGAAAITAVVVFVLAGALPAVARTVADYARRAGTAKHLEGLGAAAFAKVCGPGSVVGEARVPADVAQTWTVVPGFAFAHIGGNDPATGTNCTLGQAEARHVGTGVYEVQLTRNDYCTEDIEYGVVITPAASSGPVIANQETTCDGPSPVVRVHLYTTSANAVDTGFTAVQLDGAGLVP